jgi:hypothetical protein
MQQLSKIMMKSIKFSVLAFSLSLLFQISFAHQLWCSNTQQRECRQYINSCNYYLCRESNQNCGETGYYLRFGYPYCEKFTVSEKPDLSYEGNIWLDKVGLCLREQLELISNETSCGDTESSAIQSHIYCYLTTGFCNLKLNDQIQIFGIVYKELSDTRFMKVLLEIGSRCQFSNSERR